MAERRGALLPASDGVINGAIYRQTPLSKGASYGANYSGLLVVPAQHIFRPDIRSDEICASFKICSRLNCRRRNIQLQKLEAISKCASLLLPIVVAESTVG